MSGNSSLEVESGDVLRLIEQHLTECGLHASCRTLREESGIGAAATHSNLRSFAVAGRWGDVLDVLETLDKTRTGIAVDLIKDIHEMAVLELAEIGETELSYMALRLSCDELDGRVSSVERRINAMLALRKVGMTVSTMQQHQQLPPDYYGDNNISRQKRREEIGRSLSECIPLAPRGRLVSLLQQSIKWQAHTGQLPMMKLNTDEDFNPDEEENEGDPNRKKKKSKRKRHNTTFDLVLGQAAILQKLTITANGNDPSFPTEKIPRKECGRISFGKQSHAECAIFLKDGSGLVTGSSDGFVEIWDPTKKYGKLNKDKFPYQQADETIMMHQSGSSVLSLACSPDGELLATGASTGEVKVWKLSSGKCLRKFERAHSQGVLSVCFSRDGNKVLTAGQDFLCREFGLRASRMLKEFMGHTSYVNACGYAHDDSLSFASSGSPTLLVITASADGSVRVWDGKTSENLHVLRPSFTSTNNLHPGGTNVSSSNTTTIGITDEVMCQNMHTLLFLHSPQNTIIVVPRGPQAFLMNYTGSIIRTYTNPSSTTEFIAATISSSNKWLYLVTNEDACICFHVASGKMETRLSITSGESSGGLQESASMKQGVLGIVHHPFEALFATHWSSNDANKGVLKVWK